VKHFSFSLSPYPRACALKRFGAQARLPVYHFCDAAVDSRHRKKMEVPNGNPFPFSIISRAVENMKRKFEVSECLLKCSNRLLDSDIHSHLFLDAIP
jgi:hypothetical protein